jgi:hypothetical protein
MKFRLGKSPQNEATPQSSTTASDDYNDGIEAHEVYASYGRDLDLASVQVLASCCKSCNALSLHSEQDSESTGDPGLPYVLDAYAQAGASGTSNTCACQADCECRSERP